MQNIIDWENGVIKQNRNMQLWSSRNLHHIRWLDIWYSFEYLNIYWSIPTKCLDSQWTVDTSRPLNKMLGVIQCWLQQRRAVWCDDMVWPTLIFPTRLIYSRAVTIHSVEMSADCSPLRRGQPSRPLHRRWFFSPEAEIPPHTSWFNSSPIEEVEVDEGKK